jgi:hypothetical protein
MTTRPRFQEFPGEFSHERADITTLTIREWRRLDAQQRRLRWRLRELWRRSR